MSNQIKTPGGDNAGGSKHVKAGCVDIGYLSHSEPEVQALGERDTESHSDARRDQFDFERPNTTSPATTSPSHQVYAIERYGVVRSITCDERPVVARRVGHV